MFKGTLQNEFGDVVAKYWLGQGWDFYTVQLYGIRQDGYTLEGIHALADRLGLYVIAD